jgi:hypothetical protein
MNSPSSGSGVIAAATAAGGMCDVTREVHKSRDIELGDEVRDAEHVLQQPHFVFVLQTGDAHPRASGTIARARPGEVVHRSGDGSIPNSRRSTSWQIPQVPTGRGVAY